MCSKNPSSYKLVSLRGLFLLVPICHPDVNNTEPTLSRALIFSTMTQTFWVPGLEFAVPEEAPLPWQTAVNVPTVHLYLSFIGAMRACPPFPRLCWSLMITVVQASCFLTFCPPFPGLRSLVSMHGKYWVVYYHSAKMGFRSRVWEEEALWLCMFDTSLRSGLFQLWKGHVSREVRHGRFVTWEESRSWGLYKVMIPEQLVFLSQLCEISFGFDSLLPALMRSEHYSWKKNLESVRVCSPRSSALMRYFLSFSVCCFSITLMIWKIRL